MGNRLSAIVTRTGDNGTTSLDGKSRTAKFDPFIQLVGELDELNSALGVAIAQSAVANVVEHPKWYAELHTEMAQVQHDLFSLGGSVVMKMALLAEGRCAHLESQIENWLVALPPLKEFILPGGSCSGAQLHYVRTICRRVERAWWEAFAHELQEDSDHFSVSAGKYLNRLADWFFVAARIHNHMEAYPETLWRNPTKSEKQ